ncbi:Lrp/AsnC family transcriptional regulator [Streptomyces sp. NPDC058294]|uniref:Lrp/AsnC family transcriptional regulator n=1 Tax=Streptomyces sp. NPDC058294 TaxID=3346430 RepID=UPI0036E38546
MLNLSPAAVKAALRDLGLAQLVKKKRAGVYQRNPTCWHQGHRPIGAHCVLHTYLGGPTAWRGRAQSLDAEQRRRLVPARPAQQALTPADGDLLAALQRDGRATLADLATATGWSAATIARRLADLRAGGALFFDVELDNTLLGVTTRQCCGWPSLRPILTTSPGRWPGTMNSPTRPPSGPQ